MTRDEDLFDPARIHSYKDFRRATRRSTAESIRDRYTRRHYETEVGSKELADLYFESAGFAPTPYTAPQIKAAGIEPGMRVLDIGCGRGEVVFQCALRRASAVGVDYSPSAIEICLETRARHDQELRARTEFVCCDARAIPFPDRSFDRVFMLDVVEHLSPLELLATLQEARRLLRRSGTLVVHTTPNRWARSHGHRLRVIVARITRTSVPEDPIVQHFRHHLEEPDYNPQALFLHINELSIVGLKWALLRSGFRSRVWFGESGDRWAERTDLRGRSLSVAYRLSPLRLLYGWSMFALAWPRERRSSPEATSSTT